MTSGVSFESMKPCAMRPARRRVGAGVVLELGFSLRHGWASMRLPFRSSPAGFATKRSPS